MSVRTTDASQFWSPEIAVYPHQKEVRRETWTSASLTLDVKEGNITVLYDSTEINVNYPDLKGAQKLRFAFGYCPMRVSL